MVGARGARLHLHVRRRWGVEASASFPCGPRPVRGGVQHPSSRQRLEAVKVGAKESENLRCVASFMPCGEADGCRSDGVGALGSGVLAVRAWEGDGRRCVWCAEVRGLECDDIERLGGGGKQLGRQQRREAWFAEET
jgi:hypothetical protein